MSDLRDVVDGQRATGLLAGFRRELAVEQQAADVVGPARENVEDDVAIELGPGDLDVVCHL